MLNALPSIIAVDIEKDAEDIALLIRKSFATVADEFSLTPLNCPSNPAFTTSADLVKRLSGADCFNFGLYMNTVLSGFVGLVPVKDYKSIYEITRLAVPEEFRHRGYGKMLVEATVRKAYELGADKVIIGIINENHILKKWYHSQGFIEVTTKEYAFLPFTVCEMELELGIRYTTGEKLEALAIMREAAQWLIDTDKPMWNLDELLPENFCNDDEFVVMYIGNESAAALILSFEDRYFWPDVPRNRSGFIHKLAIRRKFAGCGIAKQLIFHVIEMCKSKGITELRLDCDPHRRSLCMLYESCGFKLKEIKSLNTSRLGIIDVAFYEMYIS